MKFDLNEHPHRRYNILTGEWVLVSPHRTKRPWQGKQEKTSDEKKLSYDPNCYLCPGNTRANGITNPNYESTYSFVNDFSALLQDSPSELVENGLLRAKGESGICKVVCFSPDHSLTLPLMEVGAIEEVISLWQAEYSALGEMDDINHVQIFENKGAIMGCSNPHPHGQIWAQSSIPQEVAKKTSYQKQYWEKHNRSLLGDYLEQETREKERILFENEHFIAIVPFWAVWPYEVMIAPKKHLQHIGQLNADQKTNFAHIMKDVTTAYDNLFETSFPYSMGIHQAPTDKTIHEEWHFHMSFYPPLLRSASVKKFMVGYEMFANPQRDITAEQAAQKLRELPLTHYSSNNEV
ncbi:UDP-glucose--hexose-1-phosphate uridylyltransferase [Flagellimonas sp. HMM57]|uniref:UDP-glucose--hexose-1-phosphate uridylyltransferase n=1 Tax=unclassified Flagellimonas TaxID=2644544 RepID=UPI0013D6DB73|nr:MULTISPECIES: UDP-glucose--hexose-1-phosphate uridylyltransferase [unclassified Flagellimonas]UII75344.1 UDP-glucose--hexose-1-phosphate uridylyltransferase [Flagellimonas sp. HMM57]